MILFGDESQVIFAQAIRKEEDTFIDNIPIDDIYCIYGMDGYI